MKQYLIIGFGIIDTLEATEVEDLTDYHRVAEAPKCGFPALPKRATMMSGRCWVNLPPSHYCFLIHEMWSVPTLSKIRFENCLGCPWVWVQKTNPMPRKEEEKDLEGMLLVWFHIGKKIESFVTVKWVNIQAFFSKMQYSATNAKKPSKRPMRKGFEHCCTDCYPCQTLKKSPSF